MEKRNGYIISKGFKHYFGATILYALVEQVCTMADMVFAGNFVAAEAFSAMDLALPFETLVTGMMLLLTGGAGTIASKAVGSQHFRSADKALTVSLLSSVLSSLLLTVLSLVFMDNVVSLICGDSSLSVHVREYLQAYVFGLVPMSVYFALSEILYVDGAPKLVTKAVIAGCIVDLVFDVVLMKFLHFGISGVALSSVIAYIVPVLIYLPYFFSSRCRFRPALSSRHGFAILKDCVSYGIPYSLPFFLSFVICFFVNSLLLFRYGEYQVYLWGVGFQIISLGFMVMDSIGRTVLVTMGSMLYGCSDMDGLDFLVRLCFSVALSLMVALISVVFLFPCEVTAIFGENSGAAVSSSKWSLRYISFFLLPYAVCCIKAYLAQILGKKWQSTLMFSALFILTVGGITYMAITGSDEIYISILFTGTLFIFADILISFIAKMKNPSLSTYFLIPPGDGAKSLFISIPFTEEGRNDALRQLEAYLSGCDISERLRLDINLCCEELVLKIVEYGCHAGKTEGYYFDLFVLELSDRIKVKIQDAGRPFNPIRKFTKTAAQAYLDGDEMFLSLQILNRICEELEYNYLYGQNTVYMLFRKSS